MSDTPNQNFKIVAAITGYSLRKDASGVEKYVLSGMASNANIDLTGERMADTALAAMAKSLEANAVTINNEHGNDWDDDFGEVTRLWVTDSHELMMEAELDPDHYRTKTLIKALDKGKKLGLSIGGVVKEAAMEWFGDLGRKVMTYKDIALFHVAITGTPAVADTWVPPITKSVEDWKETPMKKTDTPVAKTDKQVEEVVEETPTETPETPVEDPAAVPAPAEEPSEAPEPDTTEKSEAEVESDAEVTPDPETPPATPEAPDQKDETPASGESSPAPAEGDTSEVAKSAVFGNWAEINLVTSAIEHLSWTLQDHVWSALYDDDKSSQEKLASIADGLEDFKSLILKVATALVQDGNTDDVKRAAEAFKATAPEAVSKSLTEKDAKVAELTKSLSDKTTELETVQKSLAEKEAELEKINARKGIVFDKFAQNTQEVEKSDDEAKAQAEGNQMFANFVITGAKAL